MMIGDNMDINKYSGKDNYGKPKSEFIEQLAKCTDEDLLEKCRHYIWLSAYANNNARSDFHWMCDACYDESKKRDEKASIYEKAYRLVEKSL